MAGLVLMVQEVLVHIGLCKGFVRDSPVRYKEAGGIHLSVGHWQIHTCL